MTSESPAPPRPSEAEAEVESNAPAKIIDSPRENDEPPSEKEPATPLGQDRGEQAATSGSNSDSESSAGGESPRGGSPAGSASSQESGEVSPTGESGTAQGSRSGSGPPLPDEAPPLPSGQPPPADDDGWDFQWDATHQAYFFYNRFTNQTTWENPRLSNPNAASGSAAVAPVPNALGAGTAAAVAEPPKNERPPAGGYNPAIHGDYDPNAWYAKGGDDPDDDNNDGGIGLNGGSSTEQQPGLAAPGLVAADPASAPAAIGAFNRFTGTWQAGELNPERHNDEAKSRRQMNAFFDVDAAANSHDGRSLKAERSGKKPSKAELKAFKEKRRARKEEKRRAWLRD